MAGDGGEEELCQWLDAGHGVLVTHEHQFRGCEADAVICIAPKWGVYKGRRSPFTRAVAHLCFITPDIGEMSVTKMRKYWELEIMEEGIKDRKGEAVEMDSYIQLN